MRSDLPTDLRFDDSPKRAPSYPVSPDGLLARRRLRNLTPERAMEALAASRAADRVQLYLRDGRVIEGAILFNEFKRTGRIINIFDEISVDFRVEDVRDVRF
jgi:hypothetical protein